MEVLIIKPDFYMKGHLYVSYPGFFLFFGDGYFFRISFGEMLYQDLLFGEP